MVVSWGTRARMGEEGEEREKNMAGMVWSRARLLVPLGLLYMG
jgi:hypothetical protein